MSSSSKRKPRLSFSNKILKDKTASPLLNSTPQNLPCSPSPSAMRVATENCSTPVTSKKRCYFLEESPSQDYDVPLSQQMPIPLSQDTLNLQCTVDVGWKWQSPKSSGDYIKNVTRSKPIRGKYERSSIKPPPEQRQREPEKAEIKGFFKFQEELQKLTDERPSTPEPEEVFSHSSGEQTKSELGLDIDQLLDTLNDGITMQMTKSNLCDMKLCDSLDEADEITIVPQLYRTVSQNDSDKENKFISELLDDSDFALMKCSQEIEQLVMEQQNIAAAATTTNTPIQPINYLPDHLKQNPPSNEQFDDSFDDFLSSLPLDDIISSQDSGLTYRHNVVSSKQLQQNMSLTRHKSMPLENNRVSYQVGFAVSKQRMSAKKKSGLATNFEGCGSLSKTSSSSSSSSVYGTSSYKKCSIHEIEKKRHEALQKLEARRKAAKK